MTNLPDIQYLTTKSDRQLAYRYYQADGATVVFLCGFRSTMDSIKAKAVMEWCISNDTACLCFDYSGHGESSGRFEDGSIGDWLDDAEALFQEVKSEQKILVGSSMGGWIALLLALRQRDETSGILTIACAADFVSNILTPILDEKHLQTLQQDGVTYLPSNFPDDGPYIISQKLLDDAVDHELLNHAIKLDCPVELIHGCADLQIPWETSLQVMQQLTTQESTLTLIKDGGHRLSRPEDIAVLHAQLEKLLTKVAGQ
ncbi:MAG: alpha/beta hydrolase [Chromatiales bacterium]|nr:alpha/beta hydrolase [Chromatiales bacterium]